MTYNVFSGTLNPTQSINHPGSPGQRAVNRLLLNCCMCRVNLRMDAAVAARIVALRPALEALIVKATSDPETLAESDPLDAELIDIVQLLSRSTAAQHAKVTDDGEEPAEYVLHVTACTSSSLQRFHASQRGPASTGILFLSAFQTLKS